MILFRMIISDLNCEKSLCGNQQVDIRRCSIESHSMQCKDQCFSQIGRHLSKQIETTARFHVRTSKRD